MPPHGIKRCDCGCSGYWLIDDSNYKRYKVECKQCGKQKWTSSKYGFRGIKTKPTAVISSVKNKG